MGTRADRNAPQTRRTERDAWARDYQRRAMGILVAPVLEAFGGD
jgi:hypothetical protein